MLPFSASHCPVSDHEVTAKEAKQRLACRRGFTWKSFKLCHADKILKRNWLGFTGQHFASPSSAPGRVDCFLISVQRYILCCGSQPAIYTSGKPGCGLMHF